MCVMNRNRGDYECRARACPGVSLKIMRTHTNRTYGTFYTQVYNELGTHVSKFFFICLISII